LEIGRRITSVVCGMCWVPLKVEPETELIWDVILGNSTKGVGRRREDAWHLGYKLAQVFLRTVKKAKNCLS
jgi:hypothetical protein